MFDLIKYIRGFFELNNKDSRIRWDEIFQQMAVHTRKKLPEELLLKQRPNEEPDIYAYRLYNYRAITYGSMNRALDSLSRILNKIQYSIVCDDVVKEYINTKQFTAQNTSYSLQTYFEKIILKRIIEDPNGFILWLPTGEGLIDPSQKVYPKPYLFYSSQIYDISEDCISVLSDEKSPISRGGKIVYDGDVYYILTKDSFYKLVQITEQKAPSTIDATGQKEQYRLDFIYKHDIGEIPATVMGGDMNADGYFDSFFAPYCAFGDQAIAQFSDWQAIMVTSSYPYREEFYEECEFKEVSSEKTASPVPKREEKYKPIVKKLARMHSSPYGAIIRKIPRTDKGATMLGDQILAADIPSIRFISPDINIAKYSGESWEKLIERAEDALHLNLGNNSNQTAETTKTQKEEHYAMIDKIAANFFDHGMINSIKYCYCYLERKPIQDARVAINRPTSGCVKSEEDLVEELTTLTKDNSVPSVFIAETVNELARKRFSGNPLSEKIFSIIPIIDPLYLYDNVTKQAMAASGQILPNAYPISIYAYPILNQMANEMTLEVFLKMTNEAIQTEFDKRILKYLPALALPTINPDGGNSDQLFNEGDVVTVKPGNEQDPSHTGNSYVVKTVITGLSGTSYGLQIGGEIYTGYAGGDLILYNG